MVTREEQWQRLHIFFKPGFSPSVVQRLLGIIASRICNWVLSLRDSKEVDVFPSFSRVPFAIVASVLYGR